MPYVHYSFIIKAIQHNLQHATYEPLPQHSKTITFAPFYSNIWEDYPGLLVQEHPNFSIRHIKLALQMIGVLLFSLPIITATPSNPLDGLDDIRIKKTLIVATSDDTPNHHTTHNTPDLVAHRHSFGYDMARYYAAHLGADVEMLYFDNQANAQQALLDGRATVLLTDTINDALLLTQTLNCTDSTNDATDITYHTPHFAFKPSDKRLASHAKSYLCQSTVMAVADTLQHFYADDFLNDYSINFFNKILDTRLPRYEYTFKTYANKYGHDWRLLVAVAYQESQLNPLAVSPTGVEGIMMLTRDTARAMNVSDRTDPTQSIQGGAKLLAMRKNEFSYLPEDERLWFVLASYNMGPNAVRSIQEELLEKGQNPNQFANVYTYLVRNRADNSRYDQCVHYVTSVRSYIELLQDYTQTLPKSA